MTSAINGVAGWRTGPMYSRAEAARFAGVSPSTVSRWLHVYESQTGNMPLDTVPRELSRGGGLTVSFLQLAEIVVVSRFLSRQVKLERLRQAYKFTRDFFNLEYPFASLRLAVDGVAVLQQFQERMPGINLLVLDASEQWVLPADVAKVLESFDFEDGLTARWFPMGRSVPIVIDPRYGAGRPTIPNRRLTVDAVRQRWLAGEDIDLIADDFDLERPLVENLLRYAEKYAA